MHFYVVAKLLLTLFLAGFQRMLPRPDLLSSLFLCNMLEPVFERTEPVLILLLIVLQFGHPLIRIQIVLHMPHQLTGRLILGRSLNVVL